MPRKPDPKSYPISQGGLRFAPGYAPAVPTAAAPVEAKPAPEARPRQPQYAWQMTLEEFRQTYFPELCGKSNDAESTSQREAA